MKTTVYLASMNDYAAMNEVYASMLSDPKPGRTAVEVCTVWYGCSEKSVLTSSLGWETAWGFLG